jgi:predicted membrane channel-forming protein YqfA (hemolysin III family)
MNALAIPTVILRDPQVFWAELRAGQGLGSKCAALAIVSVFCLAIFGAIMGASFSGMQAVASAIKLPILYLATLMICFPTLHVFNLLFGSKHTAKQLLALLLSTMAITSLLVLAFAPVSAFFAMSSTNYQFIKLLNVAILAVAGVLGVRFFYRGMQELSGDNGHASRDRIVRLWIVLYMFVGTQLAWTLRPFFGAPDRPFEWMREVGGNFYTDLFRATGELFGG